MTGSRDGTDLRAVLGAAPVARDVVGVAGPDAVNYLQGQVSQDVDALEVGGTGWTFVLQPSGKVDVWARATRTADDEFVLDVDGGSGGGLVARLRRFLLRTKAEVDPLDWGCVALRGPGSSQAGLEAHDAELRVPAGWPGVEGVDLLGPSIGVPLDVRAVTAADIEALRVEAGVPMMGHELTERTIPAEAGRWIIERSVSFSKGCFTGQELVARIDSRGGNVPRLLRGLVVDGDDVPPAGASIRIGDADVGSVTSSAWSSALASAIALGYVRRGVEPPAAAAVASPNRAVRAAQVRELPLLGDSGH